MVLMKVFALALCVGILGAASSQAADPVVVDQIIAKVNGDIITRSDLDREVKNLEAGMRARSMTPQQIQKELEQRRPTVLRDKIDSLLLVQRGKDLNINVDAEVTKYLGKIQSDNKIADPDKFQQWIREQTGMSFEDFRLETKNQFLTQRVVGQEVSSKISIPRADIEKYYNEHKNEFMRKERVFLREILVSKEGRTPEEADKKAKDLVARARRGERFPELARDNSDAATAKQAGDLGGWEKDDLMKALVDAVWDKEKGYVTDPIQIDAGWLILRVEEHHKEGLAAVEEVESEVREKLYMPLFEPKIREYLTSLRHDAFLEIRDGFVDASAAPGKDTRWTDPAMLRPETVTKEEVANQTRRRRLLWLVPIPGTNTTVKSKSSSN